MLWYHVVAVSVFIRCRTTSCVVQSAVDSTGVRQVVIVAVEGRVVCLEVRAKVEARAARDLIVRIYRAVGRVKRYSRNIAIGDERRSAEGRWVVAFRIVVELEGELQLFDVGEAPRVASFFSRAVEAREHDRGGGGGEGKNHQGHK